MRIIDISVPIAPQMVLWPGAPRTEFQWRRSLQRGDRTNNSNFFLNSHAGTHVDAPLHFIAKGKSVDQLSLDDLLGLVHVLDFSNEETISCAGLEVRWPASEKVERILLKTSNSVLWERECFVENFYALREPEVRWLLKKKIRLIGIDYLSIQHYQDLTMVHQLLLQAEVIIIEGLNLSIVPSGKYELLCLPLKLQGLEGAPARVVLRDVQA